MPGSELVVEVSEPEELLFELELLLFDDVPEELPPVVEVSELEEPLFVSELLSFDGVPEELPPQATKVAMAEKANSVLLLDFKVWSLEFGVSF